LLVLLLCLLLSLLLLLHEISNTCGILGLLLLGLSLSD